MLTDIKFSLALSVLFVSRSREIPVELKGLICIMRGLGQTAEKLIFIFSEMSF